MLALQGKRFKLPALPDAQASGKTRLVNEAIKLSQGNLPPDSSGASLPDA